MISTSPSPSRPTAPGLDRRPVGRYVAVRPEPAHRAGGTPPRNGVQNRVERSVPEQFGPLVSVLRDEAVTDVFVNHDGSVWVDRGAGAHPETGLHLEPALTRSLAVSLVALAGRHVDEAAPCIDVRLADGLRVHAVLPPISPGGTVLSIRAPRVAVLDLVDLDKAGFFSRVPVAFVRDLVASRANLLVTGAGGSGKTTFLGALLGHADPTERIVTIEDVAELRIRHPHVVSLETRQPNLENAGGIDLSRLVREALRMRPDRLVVGECRGAEIRELLSALNTGHDGGAGTLHANSLETVPARLEAVGALAGLPVDAIARQAVSAFDVVAHVERIGSRRVLAGLARFALDRRGRLTVTGV